MKDYEIIKDLEETVLNRMFPEDVIPTTIVKQDFLKDILAVINHQKTEIKQLEYTLLGVMHFVDKWLDENELKQDEVNRADIMRHKTLQIIEEQQAEIEKLKKFKSYFDDLYGYGLEVINWHLNEELEPFDNFYDSAIQEMENKDNV